MIQHVVITGTGRSGTSFLVELMTHLGFDTGYSPDDVYSKKHKIARAGLEADIRQAHVPYIVKDPNFCDYVAEVVSRDDIVIEHVIVPFRDLHAAAESRRFVHEKTLATYPLHKRIRRFFKKKRIIGGLWHTSNKSAQEEILLKQVYKLFFALSNTDIPVTLMQYPRIIMDPEYLYRKLNPVLGALSYEVFKQTFLAVAKPELVHQFNEVDK